MRIIFLLFTIFVLASAYRRHPGGGDRRALHVHQLRGDNLRNHHQRHHSYKDTDDDSDEYLDDSNDDSDNDSYEDSDDDSDDNSGEAYRRHPRGGDRTALHEHQLRGDNLRNHHQRHHSYKDTDDDSHEHLYDSDNDCYEDSDDDSHDDSDDNSDEGVDTFRNIRRQPEPHFVSCFGPRRPNGYSRHMNTDFDKKSGDDSYEISDDVAYEDSKDEIPFKQRPALGRRYTYRRRQ